MSWCLLRARRRRESGAVAVEFAIVLPVLVTLLMGIITTGLSYSHALGITNAVREGARFGATTSNTGTWATDVIARVRATQFDDDPDGGLDTGICAELWKNGAQVSGACEAGTVSVAGTDFDPYPVPTVPAGACVVRVVAARNYTINAVMIPIMTGKMVRGSVARFERDGC